MPYAFQFDVPADEESYRRVAVEIGEQRPTGVIAHLVVKHEGGLRHIGLWKSQEDWERFRSERLNPALERVFAAVGVPEVPPAPPAHELQLVEAGPPRPSPLTDQLLYLETVFANATPGRPAQFRAHEEASLSASSCGPQAAADYLLTGEIQ